MVSTAAAEIAANYISQMGMSSSTDVSKILGSNYTGSNYLSGSIFGSNYGNYCGGGYSSYNLYNMTDEELQSYFTKQTMVQSQQNEYYKTQLTNQIELNTYKQDLERRANFEQQAPEQVIEEQALVLRDVIRRNSQNEILTEYEELTNLVKSNLAKTLGVGSDAIDKAQLEAYVKNAYTQATGSNLVSDIQRHGDSPFLHGLKCGTGVGLLFTDLKTTQSNIAEITGTDVKASSTFGEIAGVATGAVVTTGLVAKLGTKLINFVKSKGGITKVLKWFVK